MKLFSRKKKTEEPKTVMPVVTSSRLLSYEAANLQGIGKRAAQEDSFGFANILDVTKIRDKGLLAIVADGMGGMQGGRAASETAVATLREDFESFDYERDLNAQLRESVMNAGERIYSMLDGNGGSTLIACLFYNESLYFSCVGDSYLFLLRDNRLIHLNRKHNIRYDEYLSSIRRGSLDKSSGDENPEKEALTRFLGMEGLEDFDSTFKPLKLKDKDVLLLCSDGVGGVLDEPTVKQCLTCPTAARMCSELERNILIQDKQYQDNYTALVVKCGY